MIWLYVVIFLFGPFCNKLCESQANFLDYPSENVTTLEGGNLTFSCANTTSDGARMYAKWYLNKGSTCTSITTKKILSDGTMATLGSAFRSPLTLSNINRVWNGATVHCTTNYGSVHHVQPEPFPVISVWYVPEFAVHSKVQNVVFTEVFTFNCTPSAANPPPSSYVFERDGVEITEGVSGSILTVSSLKRSEDSGNYTCMVTNEAGSVTIATCLNILASPFAPHNITFEDVSPFSTTISWIPPSDNCGTKQPLKYSINITNNTVTLSFTTSDATTLSLTNLQHSTQYGVEIVAENEYGVSPPVASTFTTPDSVPIIEFVSIEALSLTILSVDVVLLTDGGQDVNNYTVEISGGNFSFNMTFLSVHLTSYRVMLVDILTIGETYNINVSAMNSVGESTPFQLGLSVTHLPYNSGSVSEDTLVQAIVGGIVGVVVGVVVISFLLISIILIIVYYYHKKKSDVPTDCYSQHVSYEEIEMKQIDMLCNPAYAVPSEVNKGYQGNKMANTEHITYETFVN